LQWGDHVRAIALDCYVVVRNAAQWFYLWRIS